MNKNTNKLDTNEIAKTWISGQRSCTLIIKRELAEEYDLTEPAHVILERRPDGILIKKLETMKLSKVYSNKDDEVNMTDSEIFVQNQPFKKELEGDEKIMVSNSVNTELSEKRISQHLEDLIDTANVTIREHYGLLRDQILEIYQQAKLEGFTPIQARLLIKDRVVDVTDRYVRQVLPVEASDSRFANKPKPKKPKNNPYINQVEAELVPPTHNLNTSSASSSSSTTTTTTDQQQPQQPTQQDQGLSSEYTTTTGERGGKVGDQQQTISVNTYEIQVLKSDLERARKIIRDQTEQIQQLSIKQVKTFGHKFNYNTDLQYPQGTFIPIIITSFPDKEYAYAIFDEKRGGGTQE